MRIDVYCSIHSVPVFVHISTFKLESHRNPGYSCSLTCLNVDKRVVFIRYVCEPHRHKPVHHELYHDCSFHEVLVMVQRLCILKAKVHSFMISS